MNKTINSFLDFFNPPPCAIYDSPFSKGEASTSRGFVMKHSSLFKGRLGGILILVAFAVYSSSF
jgi:hypothetical protein